MSVLLGVALVVLWQGIALFGRLGPLPRPDVPKVDQEEALSSVQLLFAWPEFPGALRMDDPTTLERIAKALSQASRGAQPAREASNAYYRLILEWKRGDSTELVVTTSRRIVDATNGREWRGSELADILSELIEELEGAFFGESKTWPDVAAHFPIGGRATVRDLETGLTFEVRRHRGDSHADVEPLTPHDTEILKRIYGGEWSWKRRAAVVNVGPLQVAASMNGMPHGWGDIFDNEFVGHFCLHFTGSRVHTSWQVDDGHQLMILKSSGRLVQELDQASPEELVRWAVAAVNHQDVVSLRHLSVSDGEATPFEWLFAEVVRPVRHINLIGTSTKAVDSTQASVEVDALVYHYAPDRDRAFRKRFAVTLVRDGEEAPWRVVLSSLRPLAYVEHGSLLSIAALPAWVEGIVGPACTDPP